MEELITEQKTVMHSINRALTNFKKLGQYKRTYGAVQNRLQGINEKFTLCEQLHGKILAIATQEFKDTDTYFTEDQFEACEATYYEAADCMADWLNKLATSTTSTAAPPAAESTPVSQRTSFVSRSIVQLPRINLPRFSGELKDWESFRDQFQSLIIGNADLSDVMRLQYLHSCVKGEAQDVIRNLSFTDANFQLAWDLLVTRYDNKRRLVHEHLHALHTLPQVQSATSAALITLYDRATISINALRNLERPVDHWDDVFVYLIVQKFDNGTRKAWELHLGNTDQYPSYYQLEEFLLSRMRAYENIHTSTTIAKSKKSSSASISSHATSTTSFKCPLCRKAHLLFACPEFHSKTAEQRRESAQKLQCCFNCLSTRHSRSACQSTNTCRRCNQKHHSLLHDAIVKDKSTDESLNKQSQNPSDEITLNTHLLSGTTFSKSNVLLATAWIQIQGSNGRRTIARALLDQGSVTTIISKRLAQRLRVSRQRVFVSVTGIGETAASAKFAAQVQISPRSGSGPILPVNTLILNSLTSYTPQRFRSLSDLSYIRDLEFADDDPTSSDPIDVIIGADLYGITLLPGIRSRSVNEPVAQRSIFGWIISGSCPSRASPSETNIATHHCNVHDALDRQLKRFWEVEELPSVSFLSPEDRKCEVHFASTHSRDANGRYIVRLPFKMQPPLNLGQSQPAALAMYTRGESRFKSQPEKTAEYRDFLTEYLDLGHMKQVAPPDRVDNQLVYIPHHAVIREHSTTTRLRVVFNASASTSNGRSLNDNLMIGPKLQTDLPSVIMRWRPFRYVYTADIAKMYRQILIHPQDVDYQRILWRPATGAPINHYQLLTVTYGTACAPYLALRVLQQLMSDEGAAFPLAVPVLRQHIYVDDCVFGADDLPLAKQTRLQLISLLAKAGFQLRKWASNRSELLDGIDSADHGFAHSKTLKADDHVTVLGLKWIPSSDVFQFDVSLPSSAPDTKRTILSTIAKCFDPLGWITPVTITAKILMQRLWLARVDWDQVVPLELFKQWHRYYSELLSIRQISIPRWTGCGPDVVAMEIHGFADASSTAYGAAVYLKITKLDGSSCISLLVAKSKVAPLKPTSIPRLELSLKNYL